jgi:uncharacterized membrane protein HdeD (DUF308 family)
MATPVIEDLKRLYHLTWWALMIRGLFSLAVGIFMLARPLESVAVFALVIAFWALFGGLVEIVHGFELREALHQWWVMVLTGVVGLGFGIAALVYYPILALTFAVIWVAWWLMATGVLTIYVGLQLRRLGSHWAWPAAFGVLSVLAGLFSLAAPPVTIAAIMALIAGFAIVGGIVLIVGAFKLRSIVRP